MTEQQPLRLARHFEVFIEDQVAQRKFNSPTEVVEEALRLLESREARLELLSRALIEGAESGDAGELHIDEIKRKAREEALGHGAGA